MKQILNIVTNYSDSMVQFVFSIV